MLGMVGNVDKIRGKEISEERRAEIQKNLTNTLANVEASDEQREELTRSITRVKTIGGVRKVLDQLRVLPQKQQENAPAGGESDTPHEPPGHEQEHKIRTPEEIEADMDRARAEAVSASTSEQTERAMYFDSDTLDLAGQPDNALREALRATGSPHVNQGSRVEQEPRDFAEVMNEIAADPRWARSTTGPETPTGNLDRRAERDLAEVIQEFSADHKGAAPSPEQLDQWRARFQREEGGSRATRVAREAVKEDTGRRLTDVAVPDWNALPPLLKGAKAMRQREIQANPEWEKNFLRVVERLDKERGGSIYARAVSEEVLDSKDLAFLAYARRDFANRLAIGETLQKRFEGNAGLSDLELAKKRNETLRNEVELDSDESAMDLMKQQSIVLAMKMGDAEIGEVAAAYQILDKERNSTTYKVWERGVQDVLKKSGVPWEEYRDTFKLDDKRGRIETRHEIEGRIAEGRSTLRNVLSWANPLFGRSRFSQADKLVRKAASLENFLQTPGSSPQRVDQQLNVITRFMALTLSHDKEVRRAFQQTSMRNEEVAAIKTKPETFKEMRAERTRLTGNTAINPQNLKTAFERDMGKRGEMIGGRPYAGWTPEEKTARFKSWDVPYDMGDESAGNGIARGEKKTGLIGAFFRWLLESVINRQKQQVQFT